MSPNAELNAKMGRDLLYAGIAVLTVMICFMVFKSLTGYEKLEFSGTKRLYISTGCKREIEYGSDGNYTVWYYWVDFTDSESGDRFTVDCSESYYELFLPFDKDEPVTLSVFADESGNFFPVNGTWADEGKAEKMYRKCFPPEGYYIFYRVGLIIAAVIIIMGIGAFRTAGRYADDDKKKKDPLAAEERKEMLDEFDRLMAEDKYGKYGNGNRRYK